LHNIRERSKSNPFLLLGLNDNILIFDMTKNKIKIVERAGGLVETNSSSSHALSICSEPENYAKPGDPEFDLDIRDNILYVPERDDFGWEYEKSNSCQTKLQYVCAIVFESYKPLHSQKEPTRLKRLLKKYLGVKDIVFEWEKTYLENYKYKDADHYLGSPSIDHQSYSEAREEILESNKTILDFIFNKKSWYFGGNDNSDNPRGYYIEMSKSGELLGYSDREENSTVSIFFSGDLGRVDFRVNMFSPDNRETKNSVGIATMIRNTNSRFLFDTIVYDPADEKFKIVDNYRVSPEGSFRVMTDFIDKNNKCFVVFLNAEGEEEYLAVLKNLYDNKVKNPDQADILKKIGEKNKMLVPVKLVSDEFGEIFVP